MVALLHNLFFKEVPIISRRCKNMDEKNIIELAEKIVRDLSLKGWLKEQINPKRCKDAIINVIKYYFK